MTEYNYSNFSSDDYDFTRSHGPAVGDKAPDFDLETADGTRRRLLDFTGELLILELGSITCPLFQSRRGIMSDLGADSDTVDSVILYVREAHPGAAIPAHGSIEDKRSCVRRLIDEDGERRTVLVDGIDGAAHAAFGGLPNAVFIINRNGCVLYRADWNNPAATRKALADLLADRPVRAKSYFRPARPTVAARTLRRAGPGSALDFFKSLPSLVWNNLIRRNLRTLLGRPQTVSRDLTC